jgi:hypothetical protein
MAAALGRSKLRAPPLDREPRSFIGCDVELTDVALELRARLLKVSVERVVRPEYPAKGQEQTPSQFS